jgi:hypothetical protein
MNDRRVVITGLGVVTPLGSDLETFWSNLKNGVSGIRPISAFDVSSGFDTRIGGEVLDFDPKPFFKNPKDLRRTDRFAQLAMGAANKAMSDSGMDLEKVNRNRFGVIVSSGIGGLKTLEDQHSVLLTKGPLRLSPFTIPMLISNMGSGMISMEFGLQGPNLCIVTACATCPALMEAFFADVRHGQALARETLRTSPDDEVALFYLGKLDLNYVWLQLGPLRRKTGWDEYWEARHSLDTVLKANPQHVRAIVSRAWIDYIVDTRMPWGTRWILGGGSRERAVTAIGGAAAIESPFYTHAEAEFALWDIHVRERDLAGATQVARRLARDFPENREVASFLEARPTTPD